MSTERPPGNLDTGGTAGSAWSGGTGGTSLPEGGLGGEATGGTGASGGSSASGGTGVIVVGGSGEAGQAGGAGVGGCGATALHSTRPIVNMLLVVDKSSSMNGTDEFPAGRWATLSEALGAALDQSSSRISFGLEFFPFADDPQDTPGTCQTPTGMNVLVPIGESSDTVPAIEKALAKYEPAGGTPTADALKHAYAYFKDGAGKGLPGTSYVLLATDGGPNCNLDLTCGSASCTINLENPGAVCGELCCDAELDPKGPQNCVDEERTVAAVESLADEGIKTFVVGIPGSEVFGDTLDKLAVAGREPNPDAPPSYYRVTGSDGPAGLADVLKRITSGLITSCRLQLGSTPEDPSWPKLLNVEIDGKDVPPEGTDGWTVDMTTAPPTIVLAGKTCDYLEQHGAESVLIKYGCPTVMVR